MEIVLLYITAFGTFGFRYPSRAILGHAVSERLDLDFACEGNHITALALGASKWARYCETNSGCTCTLPWDNWLTSPAPSRTTRWPKYVAITERFGGEGLPLPCRPGSAGRDLRKAGSCFRQVYATERWSKRFTRCIAKQHCRMRATPLPPHEDSVRDDRSCVLRRAVCRIRCRRHSPQRSGQ